MPSFLGVCVYVCVSVFERKCHSMHNKLKERLLARVPWELNWEKNLNSLWYCLRGREFTHLVCQSDKTLIKVWCNPLSVRTWRTGHSSVFRREGSLVRVPLRIIWKHLLKKHMVFDPIISLLENFTIDTLEKLHQDVRIHRTLYKIKNNLHAH